VTRSPRARCLAGVRPRGRCSWAAVSSKNCDHMDLVRGPEHDSARRASRRSAEARRPSGPRPETPSI
jgi:hypothetical protein